jgi:uncharacterized membrane protein HdeD (DUF308 family)
MRRIWLAIKSDMNTEIKINSWNHLVDVVGTTLLALGVMTIILHHESSTLPSVWVGIVSIIFGAMLYLSSGISFKKKLPKKDSNG